MENKEKLIKKEVLRLKKLFNDLPNTKKEVTKELIENAAFISVTLNELKDIMNKNGVKEEYKNGRNQYGYKDSVESKNYDRLIKNYMAIIKQLTDLLPKEDLTRKEEVDEFDKFNDEQC
jgi:predicted transcriptional regulator